MKNLWKYLSIFFSGAITGILVFARLKKPDITTDTYIEDQNQKIGKIKQKGEGNKQDAYATLGLQTKKELRKVKRQIRKATRRSK